MRVVTYAGGTAAGEYVRSVGAALSLVAVRVATCRRNKLGAVRKRLGPARMRGLLPRLLAQLVARLRERCKALQAGAVCLSGAGSGTKLPGPQPGMRRKGLRADPRISSALQAARSTETPPFALVVKTQ